MSTQIPSNQESSPVEEKSFKAQLALHDSCQRFASEILRLCLGGIAVVGVLLPLFSPTSREISSQASPGLLGHASLLSDPLLRWSLLTSVIFLGIGSASSLRHKFSEANSLYYHLRAEGMKFPNEGDREDDTKHRGEQNKWFQRAQFWLTVSAFSLGIGAGGLIIAFWRYTLLNT